MTDVPRGIYSLVFSFRMIARHLGRGPEEVQRAHELLKQSGLIIETHASGTNVEGDLSQILQVVEHVHAEGTVRLITVVKLETRTDKVPTLAGKRL